MKNSLSSSKCWAYDTLVGNFCCNRIDHFRRLQYTKVCGVRIFGFDLESNSLPMSSARMVSSSSSFCLSIAHLYSSRRSHQITSHFNFLRRWHCWKKKWKRMWWELDLPFFGSPSDRDNSNDCTCSKYTFFSSTFASHELSNKRSFSDVKTRDLQNCLQTNAQLGYFLPNSRWQRWSLMDE